MRSGMRSLENEKLAEDEKLGEKKKLSFHSLAECRCE